MRRGPALSAIATLSTLTLTGTVLVAPAQASEGVSLSPETTITTGGRPRDLDVDAARQQLSVPVQQGSVLPGQDADAPAGHIARIDLADPQTQQRYQVTQPRPSDVVSSADGSRLYVLNASHGSITVLDVRSGAVEREIEGVVTSSNGIVLDADSGDLYVFDNFGLQRVVPSTGEVMERTEVSRHERPFLRDAVYDAQHRLVWLANANEGVVTAYSTVTHQWVRTVRVPVAEYRFEGTALGANPRSLAIDPSWGTCTSAPAATRSRWCRPPPASTWGLPSPWWGSPPP